MSKLKFTVVGPYHAELVTLALYMEKTLGFERKWDWEQADFLVFYGGTDVNPTFYGQTAHAQTDKPDIDRDIEEMNIYAAAKALGKPCVGVCRGAQLLTVLNGGELIQHVQNHHSNHTVTFEDGSSCEVNSSHHQMMYPEGKLVEGEDFELIAWSNHLSGTYQSESATNVYEMPANYREAEVVLYPKTGDLCIQSHPEWESFPEGSKQRFNQLITNHVKEYVGKSKLVA